MRGAPAAALLALAALLLTTRARACALTLRADAPVALLNATGVARLRVAATLCGADGGVALDAPRFPAAWLVEAAPAADAGAGCARIDLDLALAGGPGQRTVRVRADAGCVGGVDVVVAGIGAGEGLPPAARAPSEERGDVVVPLLVVLPGGDTLRAAAAADAVRVARGPPEAWGVEVRRATGDLLVSGRGEGSFEVGLEGAGVASGMGFEAVVAFVAARVAPVVVDVEVPAFVDAREGGGRVVVVFDERAGDSSARRLKLRVGGREFVSDELDWDAERARATFALPPLDGVGGELVWEVDVFYEDGSTFTVRDERPPGLRAPLPVAVLPAALFGVSPGGAAFNTSAVLTLAGVDIPTDRDAEVVFAGVPVPQANVESVSSTQIVFRTPLLPPGADLRPGDVVDVTLESAFGLAPAGPLQFMLASGLRTTLVALMSSFDPALDLVVLPVMCSRQQVPVLLASTFPTAGLVAAFGNATSSYEFSYRVVSDAGASVGEFAPLDSGDARTSALVALERPGEPLFSSQAEPSDYVEVLVRSTYGAASGEASVRVSRRLRPDKVGVSIVPPIPAIGVGSIGCTNDDLPASRPFLIEGTFSSALHCPDPSFVERRTTWTVDGNVVAQSVNNSLEGTEAEFDSPAYLGFGSGVVVPGDRANAGVEFGVRVEFFDSDEGKLFAEGEMSGESGAMGSARPVAQINSGEDVTMAQAGSRLPVFGINVDGRNITDDSHGFAWTCKTMTPGGTEADCAEELLPILDASGLLQSFSVEIPLIAGSSIVYGLTIVVEGGLDSRPTQLLVRVVDDRIKAFRPSQLMTDSGDAIVSTNPCRSSIMPTQGLFLTLRRPGPGRRRGQGPLEYFFGLFADGAPSENLIGGDGNGLLVDMDGYWSNSSRVNSLFGLKGNVLAPGPYTLLGSLGRPITTANDLGSQWTFTVAPELVISVSRLPITRGNASETLFHAAIETKPAGLLSYFALRDTRLENPREVRISPKDCLGSCTGSRVVSFHIDTPGTYYLQVEVVGPISEVLGSVMAEQEIVVVEGQGPGEESTDLATRVAVARNQNDETAFLRAAGAVGNVVLAGGPEAPAVSGDLITNISRGLRTVASNSLIVPRRASKIVSLATPLLEGELQDDALDALYLANQAVVVRASQVRSDPFLVEELVAFYGSLRDKLPGLTGTFGGVSRQDQESGTAAETLRSNLAVFRRLSLRAVVGAAMRGRPCGFSSVNEFANLSSTATAHCSFPEAVFVDRCGETRNRNEFAFGRTRVVGLAESGTAASPPEGAESGDNILWSRFVVVNDFSQDLNGDRRPRTVSEKCINVSLSVDVPSRLRERVDTAFSRSSMLVCPQALRVFERHARSEEAIVVPTSSIFPDPFRYSDAQTIDITVPGAEDQELLVSVDVEELENCGGMIEGLSDSSVTLAVVVSLIVIIFLGMCTGCAWWLRWRRRELRAVRELSKPTDGAVTLDVVSSLFGGGAGAGPSSSSNGSESGTWDGFMSKATNTDQRVFFDEESESEEFVVEPHRNSAPAGSRIRGETGSVGRYGVEPWDEDNIRTPDPPLFMHEAPEYYDFEP